MTIQDYADINVNSMRFRPVPLYLRVTEQVM